MNRLGAAFVCAVLLFPAGVAAEGQGGGNQRAGKRNSCGSDLVVVTPAGEKRRFASVAEFLGSYPSREIDQGEKPRQAVPLGAVLKAYSAEWVDVLDCDNHGTHLPVGLPIEGEEFLVMTGRGGLKSVREVRPGNFANTANHLRKLTFHSASKAEPRRD